MNYYYSFVAAALCRIHIFVCATAAAAVRVSCFIHLRIEKNIFGGKNLKF